MALPSIRVVKQFSYRGVMTNYSNRYHFTGGTPADSAHWTTLSDAIVTAEKAMHCPQSVGGSKIVQTYGYVAGSEVPVFSKTYTTDGTCSSATYYPVPGDVAGLIRWSTAYRSTKNHPIYCFNYYHAVGSQGGATTADQVNTNQKTAMTTYAASWVTGFSDGSITAIRASPSGHPATGSLVEPLLTHRDIPR